MNKYKEMLEVLSGPLAGQFIFECHLSKGRFIATRLKLDVELS